MKNILYTIILFFLFANVSLAVKLGYITGNKYQELSEADQTTWVVGVLDGIIAEDTFKRKSGDASIPWLSNCYDSGYELIPFEEIVNTTQASFAAIKSLEENRWIDIE